VNPKELRYAITHEWVHIATNAAGQKVATVGISAFAIEALTDLVHIELPEVGRHVAAGEAISEIESVKAVSDIYAPVDGEIVAVNERLPDSLDTLADDPYGEGWIVRIRVTDASGLDALLDYDAYAKQCQEGE
jgi:glycine cleavage system H protein